jgi:hypothetical protein
MNRGAIRILFAVAALYDGALGLLFLFAPLWMFHHFEITPPNHVGYVQFPAALLAIFGLMFLNIAREPEINAPLILYGILLKVAYCGVAFAHWASADIPWIWKPFAIIDLIMLVLFMLSWQALHRAPKVVSDS